MKKRNLLLVILAVLLVFGMVVGCGPAEEDPDNPGGGGNTTPTAVAFQSLTADGSGLDTTTTLTLVFDKAITGLAASNITVTTQTGATKGTLSGSGPTYTLTISGVTSDGIVQISVARTGFAISPASKEVNVSYSASGKAAKYFGGYSGTYKLNNKDTIEYIKFEKNRLMIWDNTATGTNLEFINVEITKWGDAQIPSWEITSNDPINIVPENFNIGFKLTCIIKTANPKTASYLYGSKTAPGFTQTDITNSTPAIIYLYAGGDDDDDDAIMNLTLLRSIFTKNGADTAPITGSDLGNTIRFYRVPRDPITYPN